jgi:hypothetical protein
MKCDKITNVHNTRVLLDEREVTQLAFKLTTHRHLHTAREKQQSHPRATRTRTRTRIIIAEHVNVRHSHCSHQSDLGREQQKLASVTRTQVSSRAMPMKCLISSRKAFEKYMRVPVDLGRSSHTSCWAMYRPHEQV